jgi:hypothetical protein
MMIAVYEDRIIAAVFKLSSCADESRLVVPDEPEA